jgi:aquaporin PIP
MLTRKISPARCLAHTVAQLLGAICGTGFVRIMTPALFDKVDGGANEIGRNATARESLGVEFACTGLLVLTVMAATDAHRADAHKHLPTIAPLVIGLAVTVGHFVAVPVDNCSINPARSFGTSVISGNFNDHWVFWFGPYFGSTAAALLYYYVFSYQPDAADAPSPRAALPAPPAYTNSKSLDAEAAVQVVDDSPVMTTTNEWR